MGSLVPVTSGGLSVYDSPNNPWAEAASVAEIGTYFKFNGNTGDYTYGADDNELPLGSRLVANLFEMSFGWTCWVNSEPVEEILVRIMDGKPPLEHELTDHGPYDEDGDGWREAVSIPMILYSYGKDENDPEAGTKLLFKGSSKSADRACRKLSGLFGRQFREHQGKLPIVEIGHESFRTREKKHGKKYAPTFKIVGWISEEELQTRFGDVGDSPDDYEDDPVEETRPARGNGRSRAREEEEEEEAPTRPVSRRRRAPVEEEEYEDEEDAAPTRPVSRRRRAPVEEEEYEDEEEAPSPRAEQAPRRRRASASMEQEDDLPAPTPRGRSPQRGNAPAARLRRFA